MSTRLTKRLNTAKTLLLLVVLCCVGRTAKAQSASTYSFTALSGTFTDITGTTGLVTLPNTFLANDQTIITIPIGFPFNYCGNNYNNVAACTNGWLSFNTAMTTAMTALTNTLANLSGTPAIRPGLMPLWDDMGASPTSTPAGAASYVTTGAMPNRVFTFQYKNWQWNNNTGVNMSIQVKLYEGTNVIEYIYQQGGVAGTPASATIGIVDGATTATYLTLNNATATATASSTTFTTNINSRPATGQVYRFTPPPACNVSTTLPTAGTVTATPASICSGGNVSMTLTPATAMPVVTGITYKWQSSPTAGGTYTDIPGAVTTSPTYTTTVPVTTTRFFKCVVLCNITNIVMTSSASNQVTVTSPAVATLVPGSRCGPGSVALSVTTPAGVIPRWYAAATGGSATQIGGNTFNTPYIPVSTNFYVSTTSDSSAAVVQVGMATTTSGGTNLAPGPFSNRFRRTTMQLLYTAAEINAAGGPGGMINSIAFNCTALPTNALPNYTVSMGYVPAATTTLTWQPASNLTQVYNTASLMPTATGWHTLNLTTPFAFNSNSNIVIQLCWDQIQPAFTNTGNHEFTSQTGRMLYDWTDAAGTSCGLTGTTTASTLPNIRFGMSLFCETARMPIMASVNASPVVAKTFPPVVCNNSVATISLTPPASPYSSYSWTPAANLYTNATATTPYVAGNSATTVYMKTANVGQQAYYLMAGNPGLTTGCNFADTLSIHVQPGQVTIKNIFDTICVSGTTTMTLDTAAGYYPGSIQWQSSVNGVTYTDIAGANNVSYTTPTLSFGQNTYYRVLIRAGANTCHSLVKYIVVANPMLATASDSFNCGPGSVTLQASASGNGTPLWYTMPTGGTPIATGSPFVTPYLTGTTSYYVSAGGGTTLGLLSTVGLGALTSALQGSTPFSSAWGGSKHQYLIRATELIAAGIPAGAQLNKLALDVVAAGVTYPGFAISMKHTNLNVIGTAFETGTVEVKAPATHTTTIGINNFDFTTPFAWDGTSNILIQTCWSNGTGTSVGSTVKADATTYASTRRGQSDNLTPANMCGVVTPGTSANLSQRPKFIFGYDLRCESVREEVVAYIRPVPEVDLGPDRNVCLDAGAVEVLDAGVHPDNPQFHWDNNTTSQVCAVSETGTYIVKVTNEYTCSDADTIQVIIRSNPVVELGNDTSVCNGALLTLDAGDDGIEYFWNTGQNTQTINISSAGSYNVFVTNDQGCTKADTINVQMNGEFPTVQGIQTTNNGQYTFTFTAINPQYVVGYDWDFGDGSLHSNQASPTHTYQNDGNYIVVLRLTSTCGNTSDTVSAHILAINQISLSQDELKVYPNPTRGTAVILNNSALNMQRIAVYSVTGQIVHAAKTESKDKHTLKLEGLASGLYTIQIFTDKGTVTRKLEVIQ